MILTFALSALAQHATPAQSGATTTPSPIDGYTVREGFVNTFTHNRQLDQALAADQHGNILSVWDSRRQEVGTFGIFGAWLDPLGRPLGTELHINQTVQGNQTRPSAAIAEDGSAWVVWESTGQDGDGLGIYARRLTQSTPSAGSPDATSTLLPNGDEIRINQQRSGDQIHPVVEINSQGDVLIAWEDWSTGNSQVKARLFQLDGTAKSDEFSFGESDQHRQILPCLAPLANGTFAAVWATNISETGAPINLQGRILNSDLQHGNFFQIDTATEAGIEPSIDSDGESSFAVAWMSTAQTGRYDAWFRIFDAQGDATTDPLTTGAGGDGWRTGASVAMNPNGQLLVAYSHNLGKLPINEPRRPHEQIDIRARMFDANGKAITEGFRANYRTEEEQTLQTSLNSNHILWTANNQLAFAWHGNADGDRRAAGLSLHTPNDFTPEAPPAITAIAAANDITMAQVWDTEVRPDWDPNWKPEPLNPALPRGGLGGFTAFNSTGWTPPDPNLAVGPNHIVGVVNSQISFFEKDGTQTYTKSLSGGSGFFGNNISGGSAGSFVFDPIALYSSHHDRFVVASAEDTNNTSYICIGVSDDNDPNGNWHTYRITATSCGFLDFPNIGIDENAVYISGDCFSGGGNDVYIFPLSSMMSGSAMTPTKMDMSNNLLSLCCVKNYDTNTDVQYFVTAWEGSNSQLTFYAITDPISNPQKHSTKVSVATRQSPPGADQLGTSNKADTIDNRIKHGVYRNGRMWFCHNVGAGTGGNTARVRWYEFDMNGWPNSGQSPTQVQYGTLNYGDGEHNWFGDIHVDDAGNAAIAYHRSSSTQYIEIEYVMRKASDPAGFMGPEETLQDSTRPETGSRWGDYSEVEEDPSNPGSFWSHHEYRTSSWRTWMGHFGIPPGPELSLTSMFAGIPVTLMLNNADPNELVYFLYSSTGTGSGPCYTGLGGLCVDLLSPVNLVGSATADASGYASLVKNIPSSAPKITIWVQAVMQRGTGGVDSVKSNVAFDDIK